jgi:DNA-directed RNA polymerase specialized sigma24 family protein
MTDSHQDKTGSNQWPVTDWSDLARTAVSVGHDADRLGRLVQKYQDPLRRFLILSFPSLHDNADEILQDFSQDKILKAGWLSRANRTRGRFRDFLKTSLRNFVHDRLRRQAGAPTSLEVLQIDPAAEQNNDELFDLSWVREVLSETLKRMKEDCHTQVRNQPNRSKIWEVFQLRVLQPIFEDVEPLGYGELVVRCGVRSPFEAQNLLATAKRMFARHFGQVIQEYEGCGQPMREEVEHFRNFLATVSKRKNH